MNIALSQRIIVHKGFAYDSIEHGWYRLLQGHSLAFVPNRPDQGFNATDSLYKGMPINADNLGCLDLISTTGSWQDASTSRNYIFSILNTDCSY